MFRISSLSERGRLNIVPELEIQGDLLKCEKDIVQYRHGRERTIKRLDLVLLHKGIVFGAHEKFQISQNRTK